MLRAWALVALYIFGLWWCYEVICRFREDIREILEVREFTRTAIIIFVWAVTAIIAVLLIFFGFVMIDGLISIIREVF